MNPVDKGVNSCETFQVTLTPDLPAVLEYFNVDEAGGIHDAKFGLKGSMSPTALTLTYTATSDQTSSLVSLSHIIYLCKRVDSITAAPTNSIAVLLESDRFIFNTHAANPVDKQLKLSIAATPA